MLGSTQQAFGYVWLDALSWGVLLLAVLTNLTVIQRAVYFRKASQDVEKEKFVV